MAKKVITEKQTVGEAAVENVQKRTSNLLACEGEIGKKRLSSNIILFLILWIVTEVLAYILSYFFLGTWMFGYTFIGIWGIVISLLSIAGWIFGVIFFILIIAYFISCKK